MYASITIIGNLGKDPEIKKLQNGSTVAHFSVATTERWTKDGEKQERTTWFNVDVWQQGDKGLATNVVQPYLRKGSKVFISGQPTIDEVEKDGVKQRYFKIKLSGGTAVLKLLDSAKESGGGEKQATGSKATKSDASDDDIPF